MSAPLPQRVRWAALFAIGLSAMVGLGAAGSMAEVMDLEQLIEAGPPKSVPFGELFYSKQVIAAQFHAQIGALQSMRTSRVVVEVLLSTLAAMSLVSAIRLLRPAGVPREGVRKMLGLTALGCAIMRTLDGAQSTALAKKVGVAIDKAMLESSPPQGYVDGVASVAAPLMSLFFTLVFVGGFLAVSAYFGSAGVRAVIAREAED